MRNKRALTLLAAALALPLSSASASRPPGRPVHPGV